MFKAKIVEFGSWEIKLRNKRGVSKIRQMLGPFQIKFAGDQGPPVVRQRSYKKCPGQEGNWILCQAHLPTKGCSKLQRCVKPELWTSCHARTPEKNAEEALPIKLIVNKL